MIENKQLTIIVPSYKDIRIIAAIKSIRVLDDQNAVKVLIIDGDSGSEFCDSVRAYLNEDDVIISEPDEGIFDALNKGLDAVTTPYIGWLGSDDFFSGVVKSSEIIAYLKDFDLFIGDLVIFSGNKINRRTFSWFSRSRLPIKLGIHNPHYATFGRASTLKKYRFLTSNKAADIGYFLKVFSDDIKVKTTNRVTTFQAVGGFSNTSLGKVLEVNGQTAKFYGVLSPVAIPLKLLIKILSLFVYRFFPQNVPPALLHAYVANGIKEYE